MGIINLVNQLDNLSELIKTPNSDRPISNAIGAFGRVVCDRLSAVPSSLQTGPLGGPAALCQPYWDSQGYSAPVSELPFTGGQCLNTTYNFRVRTVSAPNTNDLSVALRGNGPLQSRARAVSFNEDGEVTGYVREIFTRRFWSVGATPPPLGEPRWIAFGGTATVQSGASLSFTIEQLTVQAGPDDCGDPPPVVAPGPTPAPDPGPLPPGTGFDVDVRGNPILVLPPTLEISPDFNLEVPIGEINLGGDLGGGAAIAPLPGDEEGGNGSGAGGGDNDFGEPPEGERWVGCCVTITALPSGSGNIPQAEPESIYPRTIGNVRLRFSGSSGLSAYDTPLVNRQKTTCVWEPVRGLTPTGVRVNLLPGFSYVFTPYSVPLEQ